MREKVSTAYFLDDPRKFSSMEEAEKELIRLRAVCVRLKKKQGEEIAFMLGLSVTDSQYIGRIDGSICVTSASRNYNSHLVQLFSAPPPPSPQRVIQTTTQRTR